jgi:hypothetical protein
MTARFITHPRSRRAPDLTWANLVRKSAGATDGVEGLAEVVGYRVGGSDAPGAGLDLDGAVPAGGAGEPLRAPQDAKSGYLWSAFLPGPNGTCEPEAATILMR